MIKFSEWFILTTVMNMIVSFFIHDLSTSNFIGSCLAIIILIKYWRWVDSRASEKQARK